MNARNTITNNHLKRFPSNAKQSVQIDYLKDAVDQLSAEIIRLRTENENFKKLLNPEITTKRILELIDRVKEHTSSMPDQTGENRDHDKRYLTRAEWKMYLRGEIKMTGLWIGIWRWFVEGNNLSKRWDRNYGVGDTFSDADFQTGGDPYELDIPEEP